MSSEKLKDVEKSCLDETPKENPKPLPLCGKLKVVLANITVEPILICFIIPCVMSALATQNLSLEKACRVNLGLEEEVCDALTARNSSGYNQTDEAAVQSLVATMSAWKNIIQSLVPTVLMLFWGSWSDRHQRRKPCFLLPILGEILAACGLLLCAYFFYELPLEVNTFFEAVPPAFTGGWCVMFMAVFSYISGITSVETRTIRIGAVNLLCNIGITIGIALSGVLYKLLGFFWLYSMGLCMYFVGAIYGVFCVKEIPRKDLEVEDNSKKVVFLKDFFNIKHLKDTFKVAFKNGPKNRKNRICAIMVLVMIIIGPMHGEMNVLYLFVRYRFQWNEIDYSLYSTFHFVVHITGTVFALTVFTKFFKVDDALLGLISSLTKIAAGICYAFAPNAYYFYAGAIIESMSGVSHITMRSIISKLVPAEELGKINSLFGVSEALMPLIYGPLYSMVYKATIYYFPGTFFILGSCLTTPAIFVYLWLYQQHLQDRKKDTEEKEKINLLKK